MTNTEHMELARLCVEWRNKELIAMVAATFSNKAKNEARAAVFSTCIMDLEAILNAATITTDPKEEPPDI